MNALITTEVDRLEELKVQLAEQPSMVGNELASKVSTQEPYFYGNPDATFKVATVDLGVKKSILDNLVLHDVYIKVFPYDATFEELEAWNPDGYFLSNGPGDPAAMPEVVENVKKVTATGYPVFGICLGHQLLGEALGASVVKSQTPEIGFRKISISREVHSNNLLSNFSEDMLVLQGHSAEISNFSKKEVSVLASSDNCSIQALSYLNHAFSVQFHPEVVDETIQNWISIPKIKQDFYNALGEKGIEGIIDYQQKNRRSLINGAKLIYENWLNLIERN